MVKSYLGKNPAPIPMLIPVVILKEAVGPEKLIQAPSEWTTVPKKGLRQLKQQQQKEENKNRTNRNCRIRCSRQACSKN